MTNPITKQIRQIRHQLAAKFDNDLDRIFDDLRRQQRESGLEYVDVSERTMNQSMHGSGGGNVLVSGESTPAPP